MAEKQPKKEDDSKVDWHRFEYSEVGHEDEGAEVDPEQRENNKTLKKLEIFLRKSWCCGK